MNTKRPIAPGFLDKLDRKMLLNHPGAWSSRIHLALYYGLLMVVVIAAISFLMPDDPRSESNIGTWIGFVSLISLIGLVLWSIFLLRFNVFKRFGINNAGDRLLAFVLYFISIGVFVFFPFVQPLVESARANNAFTDKEIYDDINTINKNIVQLEYDSLNHKWKEEHIVVVDSPHILVPGVSNTGKEYEFPDTVVSNKNIERSIVYKNHLTVRLANADSFEKLSDTSYIIYKVPDYNFLDPYFLHGDSTILNSYDIYKLLVQHYKAPDRSAVRQEVDRLIMKYSLGEGYYYGDQNNEYQSRMNKRYEIEGINSGIGNVMERKHRFDKENLPGIIRTHFYFTLCLTLLMFAFRHTTVKTFFLALLTGIVLSILTSLVLAFTRSTGFTAYLWLIFYFFLFFGISITTIYQKKRSIISGIATNLFTWLLPFIPLILVAAYYERQRFRDYYREYQYDSAERSMAFFSAEIIGVLLLLILLVTYLNKVYKRWYASAEE